jgi:uncharacterized protein (TIGR00255 family)
MPLRSMTGFAARDGAHGGLSWRWEMRSVNARGLDIRWRGPDGREGLEAAMRAEAAKHVSRGALSINLRVAERDGVRPPRFTLDVAMADAVLAAARDFGARAAQMGLETAPLALDQLLAQRGLLVRAEDAPPDPADAAAEDARMRSDGCAALVALVAMRAEEGGRLRAVLCAQIKEIAALIDRAAIAAAARAAAQGPLLRRRLSAVLDGIGPAVDDARLAQELALIAVKGDVAEELDRLTAHVAAACDLIGRGDPVGRRLDFLTQEFNREANTLCSKADFAALTEAGLEMKAVIDRMREQVQNIE